MTLRADDLGERVVVRHRLPDGRATDVVGRLLALDGASVTVRPVRGEAVRVPVDDVVASRVVGARRGERPLGAVRRDDGDGAADGLLTTPVATAAARTALGWSARHAQPLGDWLLRSSPARMVRGRSALAVGDPGVPLRGALDAVAEHYRGLRLVPAIQVSSALPGPTPTDVGAGEHGSAADERSEALERLLVASGWAPQPWTVLALRPRTQLAEAAAPVPVDVAPSPDAAWLGASDHHGAPLALGDLPPERDGVALAYASARATAEPREVVGVARGALAEGWLGITCVSVDPAHRRRGVAGALVTALEATLDADALYVQVVDSDVGARGFWRALGFTDHSRYRFWTLPDAG